MAEQPQNLNVSPTPYPRKVLTEDGKPLHVPEGWELLPPGDAGVTRRLKALGPSWSVVEKRGRKVFSKGVWAPAANIEKAREAMEEKRSTPQYERELERSRARRAEEQKEFVADFEASILEFLGFVPPYQELARAMARQITELAAPVGSGTVARASRLEVEEKAEMATIAWMRHQTTAYDSMKIERVAGRRREVRQELAKISRRLLDLHRKGVTHSVESCPLCGAIASKG